VNRSTGAPPSVAAVYAPFAANGLMFATWVSRLPALRARLDASEPQLGLALLGAAVGALVAMPATGWLCDRFGTRRVLLIAMIGCAAAYQVAVAVPSIALVGVTLVAVGALYGTWDVSMNAAAHEVERQLHRPLMPRFHAVFSAGGLVGAALGAGAAAIGLPVWAHLAVGGAIVVALGIVSVPHLAEPRPNVEQVEQPEHRDANASPPTATRRLPSSRLMLLGLLTVCTTLGEGAAADWGAIFLRDDRGAAEATAAVGYAAFSCAMMIGRFGGTWMLSRLSRVNAMRLSGLLVTSSLLALVAVDAIPIALLSMVGWGLGVALVFPVAMSAAAEHAARPAQGIATVATIGYGGFLIGPPFIGFLAGQAGLGVGLLVVAALGIVLVALAPAAGPPARATRPADAPPIGLQPMPDAPGSRAR
jgi:MFS family permease